MFFRLNTIYTKTDISRQQHENKSLMFKYPAKQIHYIVAANPYSFFKRSLKQYFNNVQIWKLNHPNYMWFLHKKIALLSSSAILSLLYEYYFYWGLLKLPWGIIQSNWEQNNLCFEKCNCCCVKCWQYAKGLGHPTIVYQNILFLPIYF